MTRILLISGSTRAGSTNTALLRTAAACAPDGVAAELYGGMTRLPHFNPDDEPGPEVRGLRSAIAAADAVLVCTPEYAGGLPGAFKNLLDWTVGGAEMYGQPVAWVNASANATGAEHAHQTLARVLGYLNADVRSSACARVPVTRAMIGPDGLVADPAARAAICATLAALADGAGG